MSDIHWHTVAINMDTYRIKGEAYTVRAIMLDYYEQDDELVDQAITDHALVGIFEGIPTTI